MVSFVFRHLPDRDAPQYIARMIDGRLPLWRTDKADALPMTRKAAKRLADEMWKRSVGGPGQMPTEPTAVYGVQDA